MVALYIIGGILAFIAAVLFSNIRVYITYKGELTAKVKFWFLSYTIYPNKKGSTAKKRKRSDSSEKKPNFIANMIKERGIGDTVDYLIEAAKEFIEKLGYLAEHMHITKAYSVIGVADEDAAAAAIKCGALNAIVYTFLGWLACKTKFPKNDITIYPVYDGEGKIEIDWRMRLRIVHGIRAAAKILLRLLKINFRNNMKNANNNSIKDGASK